MAIGRMFFVLDPKTAAEQYEKAMALEGQARAGTRRHVGEHGNVFTRYRLMQRHADAVRLGEEVLTLAKVKLGPDHPDTLETMNDLARSYGSVQPPRHADAVRLGEEALALTKAKLGPDHPDTLERMADLARSYGDVRPSRHADAVRLGEEVLALTKAKLGPDHPDTLLKSTS